MGSNHGNYSRNMISQRMLQCLVGGTLYKVKDAVCKAGVVPVKVGKHFRFNTADVALIRKAITQELQPVYKQIPEVDKAWLAGFFDGEGHIGLSVSYDKRGKNQQSFTAHWDLGNTDVAMMERAHEILVRLEIRHRYFTREETRTRKKFWRIQVSSYRDVAMVCRATLHYLTGVKQRKARLLEAWALDMIAQGCHRGNKFDITSSYVAKMKEL